MSDRGDPRWKERPTNRVLVVEGRQLLSGWLLEQGYTVEYHRHIFINKGSLHRSISDIKNLHYSLTTVEVPKPGAH